MITIKMTNKTFGLLGAGILMLAIVISFASAAIAFDPTTITAEPYGTSFTFDVKADVVGSYDISIANLGDVVFTPNQATFTVTPTETQFTINVAYDASNYNFELAQTHSTTVTVTEQANASHTNTATVNFAPITFCENTLNNGQLDITDVDVTVTQGFGDDDDYWYLFDTVEVELEIENTGQWDIDNVEIEWELYASDGKKIMDDTLNDFNLKDGKDEKVTFSFKLDEDVDDFDGEDAILYIRAMGEIDDNDAGVNDGESTCDSKEVNAEVITSDDFVIIDDLKLNGVSFNENTFDEYALLCGQEVVLTADAWNIGSDDQEEVSVLIHNKDLGISEMIELGDIDAFENTEFSLSLILPKEVTSKWYNLELGLYDEDNDLFENSQDDFSEFDNLVKLEGACGFSEPAISAELLSEAKENSELTIKVTIKNTGSSSVDYHLNAAGFAEWAELSSISEENINLASGESKEILFTFDTTRESAGERFFNIEILSDNQLVTSQPVVVSIEDSRGQFKDFFNENWKLLVIGLVNLILIIAIIIVAVRTYRR